MSNLPNMTGDDSYSLDLAQMTYLGLEILGGLAITSAAALLCTYYRTQFRYKTSKLEDQNKVLGELFTEASVIKTISDFKKLLAKLETNFAKLYRWPKLHSDNELTDFAARIKEIHTAVDVENFSSAHASQALRELIWELNENCASHLEQLTATCKRASTTSNRYIPVHRQETSSPATSPIKTAPATPVQPHAGTTRAEQGISSASSSDAGDAVDSATDKETKTKSADTPGRQPLQTKSMNTTPASGRKSRPGSLLKPKNGRPSAAADGYSPLRTDENNVAQTLVF